MGKCAGYFCLHSSDGGRVLTHTNPAAPETLTMGTLVLVIALGALGFGFMQHLKGKRILAAPFKKTGDLSRDPSSSDPKGAISTEGKVVPPAEAVFAPCSKTACLYYEVKIERLYEKQEKTQDGWKTVKGSDTLTTLKGGALAAVDDGTGAIPVDFSKGADFDNLKAGFKKELNGRGWSSNIQFGELNYDVPPIGSSDGHTIGFKATEKYVPVEGNLFVLGKLEGAKIVKPGWRSMMVSSKGRDGLLASTAKKKKFSLIGGGVSAVASIPLFIFAPAVSSSGTSGCGSTVAAVQKKCSDNVSGDGANHYAWTIAKDGQYDITVTPPTGKKYPLDAEVVVKDDKDQVLADKQASSRGEPVTASLELKAGNYTVTVKNSWADSSMTGGYDYSFEVRDVHAQAEAKVAAAEPAKADAPAAGEETPAAQDNAPVQIDAPKLAVQIMTKQAHYDGKTLEVKGLIQKVQYNVDSTMIVFATPTDPNGGENEVTAFLPAKAKVKKNQVVTVRGIANDDESGIVIGTAELLSGKKVAAAPKGKAKK
jgi:hypothetical protein